jgi:hypothetical protein
MSTPLSAAPKILGRPRSARRSAADDTSPVRDAAVTARCRQLFRLLAVLLLGLHVAAFAHAAVTPADRSYLAAADAYQRDDVGIALQACRGPLTAWLLAAVSALTQTNLFGVKQLPRLAGGLLFLVVLAAFEWLLTELLRCRRSAAAEARAHWQEMVPDALIVGLGYGLFILAARFLLPATAAAPDLAATGFVLAAAALLLRLCRLGATPPRSMLLGTLLAGAFLAEPILLPVVLVFLAVSVPAGSVRRTLRHLAWSVFAFAALAGPFAVALVRTAGPLALVERLLPADLAGFDPGEKASALGTTLVFFADLLGGRMLCYTGALAVLFGYAFFSRRGPLWDWLGEQSRLLWRQRVLLLPATVGLLLTLLLGPTAGGAGAPFLVLAALALPETLRFRQPQLLHVRPLGAALLACLTVMLLASAARDANVLVRPG